MFSVSLRRRPKTRREGESPFWISYADLMTAMMTLFLAAMAVTMVAITYKVRQVQSKEVIRANEVRQICSQIRNRFAADAAIHVDCTDNRISFGEAGRFLHDDYRLPEGAGAALARLVPVVLDAADGPLGRKWLKQVVIEGFTDTDGSYLYNLHLSLERSEWVMCMLLDPQRNSQLDLTAEQLQRVRELFLAGGVSFNDAKSTKDASRRVELRLQFYGLNNDRHQPRTVFHQTSSDRCMLP